MLQITTPKLPDNTNGGELFTALTILAFAGIIIFIAKEPIAAMFNLKAKKETKSHADALDSLGL